MNFSAVALGTKVSVPCLGGEVVKVTVPAGTQSGTDFKLSNHGVPHINSDKRGSHIVSIVVDTPVKLSRQQKKILEEFGA